MPELTNYIARADAVRAKEVAGTDSPFTIEVRFLGGLTQTQQAAFAAAADRWANVIVGDLPEVRLNIEALQIDGLTEVTIDDVLIFAKGDTINGVGQILGQASPLWSRPDSFLPALGRMTFDAADLQRMEDNGTLIDVITHEMGHVLGFGKTLWIRRELIDGAGSDDPTFNGRAAMVAYAHLTGSEHLVGVPVENVGGPGSRDSHWRESMLGTELMTSRVSGPGNALSRLTVAAMSDMGYEIDFEAGEPFALPAAHGVLCTVPAMTPDPLPDAAGVKPVHR
jgi:hypothetical protein